MPSRLSKYQSLLEKALEIGYEIHSVSSFWSKVKDGLKSEKRYLVLRHDIDTDVKTARVIWGMEHNLKVCSSYYFRLSTIDIEFMRLIEFSGGEASYHFEEIATVAKQRCLKSRDEVVQHMDCIQELFKKNLESLREQTGLPMTIVASHGDFINRLLKMPNWELLNKDFRREVGIELEVYDEAINRYVTTRHTDTHYSYLWKPTSPIDALENGKHVIYILTHPRHWCVDVRENFNANCLRFWEGVRYKICRHR
jgi:hypothetical protein